MQWLGRCIGSCDEFLTVFVDERVLDEVVGRVENRGSVSPGDGEAENVVALLFRAKVGEIVEHIGRARSAPAVNGLVGVTNGRDIVLAKQRVKQLSLGNRCVLVFVEDDRLKPFTVLGDDVRETFDDIPRECDLIGELEHSPSIFTCRKLLGERHKR